MEENQEPKAEDLEATLFKMKQEKLQARISGFEEGYKKLVAEFGVERVTALVMTPGNNPQWQSQNLLLPDDVWQNLKAQA
jgi:hypothetical protein